MKEVLTVDQEITGTKRSGITELLCERTTATADDDDVVSQVGGVRGQRIASVGRSGNIARGSVERETSGDIDGEERVVRNLVAVGCGCVLNIYDSAMDAGQ